MIRVTVVDDQTLVRQGLESLLGLADDIRVVSHAADGDEALDVIARDSPDVVLLDLRMPGRDGIATLEELRSRGCTVPVLVLTTFDDDDLVLRALRAGARGFMLKDTTLDELVAAVRTLASGGTMARPALTERLFRAFDEAPAPDGFDELPSPQPLTERETEILRLLGGGYSNREIADALFLAEGTVKNHLSAILVKLGVRDRTRAVLRALHLGLLRD